MARATAKRTRSRTAAARRRQPQRLQDELLGLVGLALALLALLSLVSFQFGRGQLTGPLGRSVAFFLFALVGVAAHLAVLALAVGSVRKMAGVTPETDWTTWVGYAGAVISAAVLFQVALPHYELVGLPAGGAVGRTLGRTLLAVLSSAGTVLLAGCFLVLSLVLATRISVVEATVGTWRAGRRASRWAWRNLVRLARILRETFSFRQDAEEMVSAPTKRAAEQADERPEAEGAQDEAGERASEGHQAPEPAERTAPKIVRHTEEGTGKHRKAPEPKTQGPFRLPEPEMLTEPPVQDEALDHQAMLALAERVQATLEDYDVKGTIQAIHPGPVVTLYEFVPARGTKLTKITNMASELAMAMRATRVRIVAPIPGKAAVGIELPNRNRQIVYLRELLEDPVFYEGTPRLRLALGKDIFGRTTTCDLAKAPHLLIAGATGAGKSVGVHAMLLSLLFQYSPDQLKLLLVDPKMLEFAPYHDLPHLIHPVVTDPRDANLALRWAVGEMERRYQALAALRVRNLEGFNEKVAAIRAGKEKKPEGFGEDALEELPYLVVVIDEFADLMMAASKEVEASVARIAQKARAAGIHLVVATQRPSTDVITGLIKANFPTRIAYQVSSKIDSRVVLDQHGAEALLGQGDMLYMDRGYAPKRVHGPYVSDEEVQKVCEFLKEQAEPNYAVDLAAVEEEASNPAQAAASKDPLYAKAVELVLSSRRTSASFIQRKLSIGYNRASRFIEMMEEEGILSPPQGPRHERQILV